MTDETGVDLLKPSELRIAIEGQWTALDFLKLMGAIDRLHMGLGRLGPGASLPETTSSQSRGLGRVTRGAVPPLLVERVSYSSPGFITFVVQTSGKALEAARQLLKDLFGGRNRQERQMRALEIVQKGEQIAHTVEMNAIAEEGARSQLIHRQQMSRLAFLSARSRVVKELAEEGRALGIPDDQVADYARRAVDEPTQVVARLVVEGKVVEID